VVFSKRESSYSQSKLELCGVTKVLKKLQVLLWGQHFELRVDAKCLIGMINNPSLPNAPMNRWIAFIQLFSFDLEHISAKSFSMPDGLSRRPVDSDEEENESFDEDEELVRPHPGFGKKEVFSVRLLGTTAKLEEEVSNLQQGFWKNLEYYLSTMNRPRDISTEEFNQIKQKSAFFFITNSILHKKNQPYSQVVVSTPSIQNKILQELHESLGHRGTEETYRRVKLRFWWPHMKRVVRNWVRSCEPCQKRSTILPMEERQATGRSGLFSRVSLDTLHIKAGRWKYLVVARDDLSGWVEAVGLEKMIAKKIANWFHECWILRYGAPTNVVVDGGSEFGSQFQEVLKSMGIQIRVTTPYYPEANGMIERGHRTIKDTLVKLSGTEGRKWREFLPLVLFADRVSTKRTTGYTPFELVFGQQAILPVDLEFETYFGIDWLKVKTTEELLEARVIQLLDRDKVLQKAHTKLIKNRQNSINYWNDKKINRKPLKKGDLVLVYNKSLDSQWGKLFENKWNGPYRIVEQKPGGSYVLEELDGSLLARRYAASHVKFFYTREEEDK
jgi:hypothetical protein